jgi:UDP-glucose 4-epimerase
MLQGAGRKVHARRQAQDRAASKCVAITGGRDAWGRRIVQGLWERLPPEQLVVLDHQAEPPSEEERLRALRVHRVDLTEPTADTRLADVFSRERVTTVLHAAFVRSPWMDTARAHELEVIGTMQVLSACAAAKVKRLVFLGSTMSYGAHPQNPNFLTEQHPMRGAEGFPFVQDHLEAELQVQKFSEREKRVQCTVLRLCPVLGKGLRHLWCHYLAQPFAPTLLGHDPLLQFLHVGDALRAIATAVMEEHVGTFNIVGRGVLPLSTVLRVGGGLALPVPYRVARSVIAAAWASQLVRYPPHILDYLTYSWVADGEKAARQLGFIPQFSVREAVEALGQEEPVDARNRVFQAVSGESHA